MIAKAHSPLHFVRRNRGLSTAFVVVSAVSAAFDTAVAFLLLAFAKAIEGTLELPFGALIAITLAVLACSLATETTYYALLARLETRYAHALRDEMVRRIRGLRLPADHTIVADRDGLQGAILSDVDMIASDWAAPIAQVVHQVFVLLFALAATAYLNLAAVPFALAVSILTAFIPKLCDRALRERQETMASSRSSLISGVSSLAGGIETLLTLGTYSRFFAHLSERVSGVERATNRRNDMRSLVWSLSYHAGLLLILGVWVIGGIGAHRGAFEVATVVALAQLMTQIAGPVQALVDSYSMMIGGRSQRDRLFTQIPAHTPARMAKAARGVWQVRDLAVRAEGRTIVGPVTLTVTPGEKILLTGPSGCGKSTLLRALAGFSDAEGHVSVDGTELVREGDRRGLIGLVGQSAPRFPGSVTDNLPDGELPDAARAILAPIATMDQEASSLSGGETQRVHASRGLVTATPLLLLDEVSAGLDPTSAALVLRQLLAANESSVIAVVHDLPDDPAALGFTRHLRFEGGRLVADEPISGA